VREKKIYSQTYIKVEESTRRRADSVGFILVHSTKVSKSNFHFWMTSKLILKSLRGNRQVVKKFKPKKSWDGKICLTDEKNERIVIFEK